MERVSEGLQAWKDIRCAGFSGVKVNEQENTI